MTRMHHVQEKVFYESKTMYDELQSIHQQRVVDMVIIKCTENLENFHYDVTIVLGKGESGIENGWSVS